MNKKVAFYTGKKFYGDPFFPYGISRSGEFNRQQSQLLQDHGAAYQALCQGKRVPADEEEKRFIEVCQGKADPVSEHEKVWLLFLKKTDKKNLVSAFSMTKPESSEVDQDDFPDIDAD